MKLLEIHKNGINAHNKTVSYYGLDYEKKKVLAVNVLFLSNSKNFTL